MTGGTAAGTIDEAYVGAVGGTAGGTYEEQVIITDGAPELISHAPPEPRLLA